MLAHLKISSKSVEIFWAEIYWGRLFFRAESNLIQSSCRSFIRVIVPYERGYETSGSPLRFMLRRSSLVERVSVLPGNRCLQNVEKNFLRQYVQPCLLKNSKYTFYTIKSSLKLAYHQKVSRFFGPRYIGDDFFLGPNLISFNRAVVPLFELSFLTREGTRLQDHLCALC